MESGGRVRGGMAWRWRVTRACLARVAAVNFNVCSCTGNRCSCTGNSGVQVQPTSGGTPWGVRGGKRLGRLLEAPRAGEIDPGQCSAGGIDGKPSQARACSCEGGRPPRHSAAAGKHRQANCARQPAARAIFFGHGPAPPPPPSVQLFGAASFRATAVRWSARGPLW
ncbi:unnamed protein product, partial [Prorocentrum cordatum]